MSEAWDKVQEAAQALKEAMDKAAQAGADATAGAVSVTKHVLDTAHRNIDSAVEWVKQEVSRK
jgi:hypothetical protein